MINVSNYLLVTKRNKKFAKRFSTLLFTCQWTKLISSGKISSLFSLALANFHYFCILITLESEIDGGCQFDYVEVRDGSTSSSPLLRKRLCGSTTPQPNTFFSTGNTLYVFLHSDGGQNSNRGFSAAVEGKPPYLSLH